MENTINFNDQWKIDYENMLINATQYSGSKDKGNKSISASSLTNDMLQLYLDYKHGKQSDTKVEASNMGSIYQLGIDKACEGNDQYKSSMRIKHTLPNGWIISGEIDQLDIINKVIIDNKLSTATALKKIHQEGKNHTYAIQLGVYKYLMFKTTGEHFSGALAFADKSASYFKPGSGDSLNYLNVETYSYDEIESMAVNKTNELQQYIDMDVEPEKCHDLFPFKAKGYTRPMRCIYYCSYNKSCRHASDYVAERSFLNNLEVTATKPNQFEYEF